MDDYTFLVPRRGLLQFVEVPSYEEAMLDKAWNEFASRNDIGLELLAGWLTDSLRIYTHHNDPIDIRDFRHKVTKIRYYLINEGDDYFILDSAALARRYEIVKGTRSQLTLIIQQNHRSSDIYGASS